MALIDDLAATMLDSDCVRCLISVKDPVLFGLFDHTLKQVHQRKREYSKKDREDRAVESAHE